MRARGAARAPGLVGLVSVTFAALAACNGIAGLDGLSFREPAVEEELCTPGAKRACYNGPQGTDGVGSCAAGVAICREDGQGYGACTGEVLPGQEDCSAPGDEDCNGQANDGCPCEVGTTSPCYSGPAGTEDVGSCHGGVQTCLETGTYGACEGEVLPADEQCSTSADEDCDAVPECGAVVDGETFGDVGPQTILGLGAGPTGEVALAGQLDGMISFGADTLSGSSPGDAYGALRLAASTYGFAGAYGSAATAELASDAAVGAGGAVVLVGGAHGPVDFGTGALTPSGGLNAGDAFVAQVGGSQNVPWATLLGDASEQVANGVALGPNGEVFVVGDNNGMLTHGTDTLDATNTDGFLVAWDAAKAPLFANAVSGNKLQRALAVAVDSGARPVVVGYAQESIDLDGVITQVGNNNNNCAYIAARTAAGGPRWLVHGSTFGGTSVAAAVAVGPSGEIVVAGSYQADLQLDACTLPGVVGNTDAFVAAFTPQGDCTFARAFSGESDQDAAGVAVGADGSIYVTGSFKGSTDFGDGNAVGPNGRDGYVVKLDALGTFVWVTILGGSGDVFPHDLAWSTAGRVVAGGAFSGALDWGTGPTTSAGDLDAFLVELVP